MSKETTTEIDFHEEAEKNGVTCKFRSVKSKN